MYSPKVVMQSRQTLATGLGVELRDYSREEAAEMAYRMKDVPWGERPSAELIAGLPVDIQEFIFNELHLSKIDARHFITRYTKIVTDDKKLRVMDPLWPGQEELFKAIGEEEEKCIAKGIPVKIWIALLKARQIGGTAISEALCAHQTFLQPHTQAVIASDHPDNTNGLWQTLMKMYDNLPGWMKPVIDSRPKATNFYLKELDSNIVYGSGNQKTTLGQSMNVDFAHLTELSTWAYPNYIDEDLIPAFRSSRKHHSMLILETTGNGAEGNWFHDIYKAAWKGENTYRPLFIAWYMRPSWRTSAEGVEFLPETVSLAQRLKEEKGVELDKEQKAQWQEWYRSAKAEGKVETFLQEYATFWEDAFQTGHRSVFPIELRSELRRSIRTPVDVYEVSSLTGKLKAQGLGDYLLDNKPEKSLNKLVVWERKSPGNIYVVAVDASYGLQADNAAIEVIRVGDRLRPDEQVAEFCGDMDPVSLARVVWTVGHVFSEDGFPAKVAVEVNPGSPGAVTQQELLRKQYPHLFKWKKPLQASNLETEVVGWWTTPSTRPYLTERGVKALKERSVWVNSPDLIAEMANFVNLGLDPSRQVNRKRLEAAPGKHDDRLMALFIALEVARAGDMGVLAEERRQYEETKMKRKDSEGTARAFVEILLPPDQLLAEWEDTFL